MRGAPLGVITYTRRRLQHAVSRKGSASGALCVLLQLPKRTHLLLQRLVCVVDAQLLEAVGLEALEAVDIQDRDELAAAAPPGVQALVDAVDNLARVVCVYFVFCVLGLCVGRSSWACYAWLCSHVLQAISARPAAASGHKERGRQP